MQICVIVLQLAGKRLHTISSSYNNIKNPQRIRILCASFNICLFQKVKAVCTIWWRFYFSKKKGRVRLISKCRKAAILSVLQEGIIPCNWLSFDWWFKCCLLEYAMWRYIRLFTAILSVLPLTSAQLQVNRFLCTNKMKVVPRKMSARRGPFVKHTETFLVSALYSQA